MEPTQRRRSAGARTVLVLLIAFVAALVLIPVVALLMGSFQDGTPGSGGSWTFSNYAALWEYPRRGDLILTTLGFALGQTVLSVGIGFVLAWLVVRTNTPGRKLFAILAVYLFLVPHIIGAIAWAMLLSPRTGWLNQAAMNLFGLSEAPIDIFSLPGMIWVQSLYLVPFTFLILSASLASMDASLEESSRMSGASVFRTLRKVTLPLSRPAIMSTSLLVLVLGLEAFEVPTLYGARSQTYTFTSLIYYQLRQTFPPQTGVATALSVVLLVATLGAVWLYRRKSSASERLATVGVRGYKRGVIDLGRWKYVGSAIGTTFFAIALGLPMLVLVLSSGLTFFGRFGLELFSELTFDNYARLVDFPGVITAFRNSLTLSVVGATVGTILAFAVAIFSLRTKIRGRGLLDGIAMLPLGFPAPVFAIGVLWAYLALPVGIYGTLWILLIAYVSRYLSIGVRSVAGTTLAVNEELLEASRMSGAGLWTTSRKVMLPLMRDGLLGAWLLMFIIFVRELPASVLLAGPGTQTVSTVLFDFYQGGETGPMASLAVLLLGLITVVMVVASRFFRRGVTF